MKILNELHKSQINLQIFFIVCKDTFQAIELNTKVKILTMNKEVLFAYILVTKIRPQLPQNYKHNS